MKDEKGRLRDLRVKDLAVLTDITAHLNSLNITLQDKVQFITDIYEAITSFVQNNWLCLKIIHKETF